MKVRVISRKFNRFGNRFQSRYYDSWMGLREGIVARLFFRYSQWLDQKGWNWASSDAEACGLPDGDFFRWWMVGYWIGKPMFWLMAIGIEVPNRPIQLNAGDLVTI